MTDKYPRAGIRVYLDTIRDRLQEIENELDLLYAWALNDPSLLTSGGERHGAQGDPETGPPETGRGFYPSSEANAEDGVLPASSLHETPPPSADGPSGAQTAKGLHNSDNDAGTEPLNPPDVTQTILRAVEQRREDPEFMARLEASIERNKPILDALAATDDVSTDKHYHYAPDGLTECWGHFAAHVVFPDRIEVGCESCGRHLVTADPPWPNASGGSAPSDEALILLGRAQRILEQANPVGGLAFDIRAFLKRSDD